MGSIVQGVMENKEFKYNGKFENDKYEGAGELTCYQTFTRYNGQFSSGKKHGEGVLTYLDHSCSYAGNWVLDKKEGLFTVTFPDQVSVFREYKHDVLEAGS